MKASKMMLSYLLALLLVFSLMPNSAFSDGPWDIENSAGSATMGGNGPVHDRDAVTSSADIVAGGDESGGDGPTLVSTISYHWLNQLGLVKLAESFIVSDVGVRAKVDRKTGKTRR